MFALGQQAPQLSFTAGIMMRESLTGGLVRAWVSTETQRCMGGGQARVDFQAGVERGVAPASMSHPGQGMAICTLPYTTTQVEFEVIGSDADHPLLVQRFPAVYHFVLAFKERGGKRIVYHGWNDAASVACASRPLAGHLTLPRASAGVRVSPGSPQPRPAPRTPGRSQAG